MTLFGKLVDQDDRTMSQNNHLVSIWMPTSFIEQRRGGVEVKTIILQMSAGMAKLSEMMCLIDSSTEADFSEAGHYV